MTEDPLASTESKEITGVSLAMLTRAALLATLVGRGIAPAIPGLAVGIAPFIVLSGRVSAFLSQLVAAGGVAAAIRLAGGALRLPRLDLGYRLVALPGSAIVIALVMAAWARPLEPELCRLMAFAAVAAALSGSIASLRVDETRAAGLVLGIAGFSGISHLLARQLVSRAAEHMDPSSLRSAVAMATVASLFDVVAVLLTVTYLGRGRGRKVAFVAALVLVPALLLGMYAARGTVPGAGTFCVLAERTMAQLSRAPAAALPKAIRFAITCAILLCAGYCVIRPNERGKASVVLSLSLLSLGAPDMPLPALWLVVAALLSPKQLAPAGDPSLRRSTAA